MATVDDFVNFLSSDIPLLDEINNRVNALLSEGFNPNNYDPATAKAMRMSYINLLNKMTSRYSTITNTWKLVNAVSNDDYIAIIDAIAHLYMFDVPLVSSNADGFAEFIKSHIRIFNKHNDAIDGAMHQLRLKQYMSSRVGLIQPRSSDPLVLDMDKDGKLSSVSLQDSEVYFDLDGDGLREKVSWLNANDAFLVYDKNENGKIDGIDELFGSASKNGFDELREIADSNYDNKIDKKDLLFSRLQVWQDANGNAKVDDGELSNLTKAGIKQIDTNFIKAIINLDGAMLTDASKYTDDNGDEQLIADVELEHNPQLVIAPAFDEIEAMYIDTFFLPQLKGCGAVPSTLIAYNLDSNIRQVSILLEENMDMAMNNFSEFIATWSGFYVMSEKQGIKKEEMPVNILDMVSTKIWILEHFVGNLTNTSLIEANVLGNLQFTNTQYVDNCFKELVGMYQSIFVMQTHYRYIFKDSCTYSVAEDIFVIVDPSKFNSAFISFMNDSAINDAYKYFLTQTLNNLEETFMRFDLTDAVAQITDATIKNNIELILNSERYSEIYFATNGKLTLNADAAIIGSSANDAIELNSNNHSINIYAGKGNDKLITKNSNDIYHYNLGDGSDTIYDTDGNDRILFGSGITINDITFTAANNDLVISISDGSKITVIDFNFLKNRIEELLFSNGDTIRLDNKEIIGLFITDGNDTIESSNDSDTINALGGNDIVRSNGGNDTLYLGEGSDTAYAGTGNDTIYGEDGGDIIYAEDGDDSLIGGGGNDSLYGGKGNDTYIFNIKDGKDTISDESGNDALLLGEGIAKEDLIAKANGNDLVVYLKETGKTLDQLTNIITIKNYFATGYIETIKLHDGTTIRLDEIEQGTDSDDYLVYANESNTVFARAGNDTVINGSKDDTIYAGSGNDTINSNGGNDTVYGEDGDDTINTGTGNDTLAGGKGSDTLYGGLGDDVYIFNRGDGKDTIYDDGGNDALRFGNGIAQDDLLIRFDGNNLIIAVKDGDKPFEQLGDKVIISNYAADNSSLENILLADGARLNIASLLRATDNDDLLIYGNDTVDINALGGDDTVISGSGHDTVRGGAGNDVVYAGSGDDKLYGDSGSDTLYGEAGNDTLDGGSGSDTLYGGLGNDTYVFGRGYGRDTIYDDERYGRTQLNSGNDTLLFNEGINKDDLWIKVDGNNLLIGIRQEDKSFDQLDDIVVIQEYFNANSRLETIKLHDGTILKLDELQQGTEGNDVLMFDDESTAVYALGGNDDITTGAGNDNVYAGGGNDIVRSNGGNDTLYLGEGSDTAYAGTGNDTIYGEDGGDIIYAEDGDDSLIGGGGNDSLYGGKGNDTYIFNIKDGKDTISDESGNDALLLGEGIAKEDLIAKANGNDLVVYLKETGKTLDQLTNIITIKNYFATGYIETIKLHDGTTIRLDEIEQGTDSDDYLVYANESNTVFARAGNDTVINGSKDDTIYAGSGNDTINSNGGNDTVYGEDGDDTINTGTGNDTLAGGKGSDTLYGGLGDDVYIFNRGDGKDTISDEGENDKLVFGIGITKRDLLLKQTGYDLSISLKEDGKSFSDLTDSIKIINYFTLRNTIETIVFDNGETLTNSDIASLFANINIKDTIFSAQGAVLRGGSGDDTYVYNRGDFTVVIDDLYRRNELEVNAGSDTLIFGTDITRADVTIGVNGDNLIIVVNNSAGYQQLQDAVVIKDWNNTNRGIETIIFSDGETINVREESFSNINFNNTTWANNRHYIYGNDNDEIQGTNNNDIIEGAGGEDIIYGYAGNDIIYGGDGNDTIDAGAGNDRVIGGKGDDYIKDPSGDDVYVYTRGDGRDFITDSTGNDTIYFSEGITQQDLAFRLFDGNLAIGVKDGTASFYGLKDRIIIKDWRIAANRIERLEFSDGSFLSAAEIMANIGTDADDIIEGFDNTSNTITSKGGNDTIYTYGEDDTVSAGLGNDNVYAGAGNDIIDGGSGNDTLYGEAGNDTYLFTKGSGHDTVIDTAGIDTIKIMGGLSLKDVVWLQDGSDLLIAIKEDGKGIDSLNDTIRVKDWYKALANRVELVSFDNGDRLTTDDFYTGSASADSLTFGAEDNVVYANAGNDTVYGGAGNDTIYGGEGNDALYGDDGNDILDGGTGNDTLNGGAGSTTYVFGRGYGKDTVNQTNQANIVDTLLFKDNITADDILIKQSGYNLIVALREEGKTFAELSDTITLVNWSSNSSTSDDSYNVYYGIEQFAFTNGLVWTTADILSHINTPENDTIYGLNGNDTLYGSDGNDAIYARNGNDIIAGDQGNDTLYGDRGNDTYMFNRGDGKDTIYDAYYNNTSSTNDAGNDTLQFGEGITQGDLLFTKSGNNIIIGIKEGDRLIEELSDTVTIINWFNTQNRIEHFILNDETELDVSYLFTPTNEADNLTYGNDDDIIDALEGNDIINAGSGDDTVYGNAGDDNINGAIGNDTLYGDAGNDTVYGGAGNDTIYGGEGNDALYGDDGNDILDGGTGNDTLNGGAGSTTYVFGRGYGKDTVNQTNQANIVDTLLFKDNITADDILIKQSGYNLIVALREEGKTFAELSDTITLVNWSSNSSTSDDSYNVYYGIEQFAFTNGLVWTTADILSHINTPENDTIYGLNGNDTLYGSDGNDAIYARNGNDIIAGDQGNDTLYGDRGNDTYMFNRGDGKDTIYDAYYNNTSSTNDAGNDTLQFGEGITQGDLLFTKSGNNIIIGIKEGDKLIEELSDTVTIINWFNTQNRIEHFILNDETELDVSYLFTPTNEADNLTYGNDDDIIDALEGNDIINAGSGDDTVYGNAGDDNINGAIGNDTLYGDAGNDTVYGGAGNDTIYGGEGNDALYGDDGNDILDGGTGNDTLNGGAGSTTYVFGRGYGKDTVNQTNQANIVDTLLFKDNITADDILIKQSGYNLIVALREEGKTFAELSDTITLVNWSSNSSTSDDSYNVYYGIEQFAFTNGLVWTTADILSHINTPENDTIYGLNGNDTLYGSDGNDAIYARNGNDIIAGDQGNDTLYGDRGNDTYMFNRGDGKDTIYDAYYNNTSSTNDAGNDTLQFGEGITQGDLLFTKSGNNIIIGIKEGDRLIEELSDTVTIINWFNTQNRIEHFILNDETELDVSYLFTPTNEADNLTYGNDDDIIDALEGNDIINAGSGDDTVYGNAGDDNINGAIGNDTLYGDAGNDTVYGGAGNDTIYGGEGNDALYGDDGNDILDGGTGNDTLNGGAGSTTYVFGRGYGKDTVNQTNQANIVDTLLFKDNITADDILIKQSGYNLIVALREEGKTFAELSDTITLVNWSSNSSTSDDSYNVYYGIEQFAFTNGLVWTTADILSHINTPENDTIYGLNGNDTLYGSDGNDAIYARNGNDIIAGDQGNDTLYGDRGNDTYMFNRGDGKDTIYDAYYNNTSSTNDAGNDTLQFGEGITQGDLVFWMNGANLVIDANNGDSVTVYAQSNAYNAIETFVLGNGSYVSGIAIEKLIEDIKLYAMDNHIIINGVDDIRTNAYLLGLTQGVWKDGTDGTQTYTPPIVLDLNSNSNTSIALESSYVYFDYDGDGIKERTAWAESGDALLAVDINGDGIINNGSELFGTYTKLSGGSFAKDGYEALAQYDTNRDRTIDASDAVFSSLKIWIDANSNGITDEGELTSLQISNISAIYLDRPDESSFTQTTENSNIISNQTNFITDSGQTGTVRDVWFRVDSSDSITNNDTINGNGANTVLSGKDGDDTYIFSLGCGKRVVDDNGDGLDTIKFTGQIQSDHLLLKWDRESNGLLIGIREGSDDDTALISLKDQILIKHWFDESGRIEKFVFTDGETLDVEAIYNRLLDAKDNGHLDIRALNRGDTLSGGSYGDILFGTDGNELLLGNDGDDYLVGGDGDDQIEGGNGSDTLDGGSGNDFLLGGAGDDNYVFQRGSGHDTIFETSGLDSILFAGGLTESDIIIKQIGSDLVIAIKEDNKLFEELSDTLTIKNYSDIGFGVERIEFDNGTASYIQSVVNTIQENTLRYNLNGKASISGIINTPYSNQANSGASAFFVVSQGEHGVLTVNSNGEFVYKINDKFEGTDDAIITITDRYGATVQKTLSFNIAGDNKSTNDSDFIILDSKSNVFTANNGDDVIYAGNGNDIIYGQNGNDTLYGEEGNDILYGESGSDTLNGGRGNDAIYGGIGNDTLYGNEGNDTLYGEDGDDTLNGNEGNDILYAGNGHDTLRGGEGDDILHAESGNDILYGGTGNDTLYGGDGNDIYLFNNGDGQDTIYDTNGNDAIRFGSYIAKEDISLFYNSSSGTLDVSYTDADTIHIASGTIEKFELSDGSYITHNNIDLIIQSINAYAQDKGILLQSTNDIRNNNDLMTIVNSGWER